MSLHLSDLGEGEEKHTLILFHRSILTLPVLISRICPGRKTDCCTPSTIADTQDEDAPLAHQSSSQLQTWVEAPEDTEDYMNCDDGRIWLAPS